MSKYSKKNQYSPFSYLKVYVFDIDYDFDGMDDDEIEQTKSELPTDGNLEYSAEELFDYSVLSKDGVNSTEWIIDNDALEELISDYITDNTGFCHNGFRFRFSIVN